jgi:predicted TIM-barrel fold metal-dependent hydrolase
MFEETGFGDKLMYSSDYPHWDFDSPYDSVAPHHPIERRRRILGENASKLLKIPLNRNTGVPVSGVPLAAE